jgi:ABC-type cobalamin/Fe3+-siderophores transport system ATPase subunit
MILSVVLRYIKTYRGINYIPLSDYDRFSGLVGDNGVGKSTVLEALDSFFNGKPLNLNIATKRSGLSETKPHVLPILLMSRAELSEEILPLAQTLDSLARNIAEADVPLANRVYLREFLVHRDLFIRNESADDKCLIPLGVDHMGQLTFSIFNCRKLVEIHVGNDEDASITSLSDQATQEFLPLLAAIRSRIEYIYIPKEIDSEAFTKLETTEIQALMGESLIDIVEKRVTPGQIQEINRSLNEFLENLSSELEEYSYRTPTDRQQYLKKQDVYNLIIQAFFNIRKLHRKQGDSWLEIGLLSSGEKQRAIIDVAHSLIKKHHADAKNLIIAVDEPESSLHMAACFDQFDALYQISRACRQLLFTTHWYGFFPTVESGNATVITRQKNEHYTDLISLPSYREQVKQSARESKGKLPYDIRLKSINDFIQSVITSTIGENPFNWIICEGSSEKIYLSAYFSDLVADKRLRIVPVGGAKEIKRIYAHLSASYDEFKSEINGKIVLISDTDEELVRYQTQDFPNLICKRMVSNATTVTTDLVGIDSNPVSPPTEIEDALNGRHMFNMLKEFSKEFPDLNFLNSMEEPFDGPSYFALDLRPSEKALIDMFFDSNNNKYDFAKKYAASLTPEMLVPKWITEIRSWLS